MATSVGKVHYFGVSNVTGWQLQKIIDTCEKFNIPRIVSLQAQYSLLCRWPEWELVDCCQHAQVSYMPWSPLKVRGSEPRHRLSLGLVLLP